MSEFNSKYLDHFLSIVRKYMQLRGPYSQKELSDLVEVGVSTISRFLNKKTSELNPQLIARIVAKLEIPLSEFIDFVEESYEERFKRLVRYHENDGAPPVSGTKDKSTIENLIKGELNENDSREKNRRLVERRDGTSKRPVKAEVRHGSSEKRPIYFEPEKDDKNREELKGKFKNLSLRHRAFVNNFMNLDIDERDLLVDIGEKMLTYFKNKSELGL